MVASLRIALTFTMTSPVAAEPMVTSPVVESIVVPVPFTSEDIS